MRLKKIRETWLTAWQGSNRKVTFPRVVADEFRKIGTTVREVQDFVGALLVCKPESMTKEQLKFIYHYRDLVSENEMNIAESVADNPRSSVFLLQSKYGYDSKQTVQITDGNLADIVKEKSQHNG